MEIEELERHLLLIEGCVNTIRMNFRLNTPEAWMAVGISIGNISKEADSLMLDAIGYTHEKFNPIPGSE